MHKIEKDSNSLRFLAGGLFPLLGARYEIKLAFYILVEYNMVMFLIKFAFYNKGRCSCGISIHDKTGFAGSL